MSLHIIDKHDVEFAIKTDRILKVLDETILKIEVAVCLPIFLRNLHQYESHFKEDELSILLKCKFSQSLEDFYTEKTNAPLKEEKALRFLPTNENTENTNTDEKISGGNESCPASTEDFEMIYIEPTGNEMEDPNIKRAIEIIWKRPDLCELVRKEWETDVNSSKNTCDLFLKLMLALRKSAQISLTGDLSTEAENKKMQFYKKVWEKNEEAKAVIKYLRPMLTNITSRVEKEFKTKDDEISDLLNKIETLKVNYDEEVNRIFIESEMNMVTCSKDSEARQEAIRSDIKLLDEKFQETLKEDMKKEKELRMKRYKVETQLEAYLEKYDTDMGAKQAEFEQIKAEFDEEERQMNILQENFDKQEKEYIILMKEKAEEDRLELERKIEDLRRRVAARIIQTHWREYKRRKLERAKMRRGKKGKGKKKTGKKSPSPKRPGSSASSKKGARSKKGAPAKKKKK